MTRRDPKVRKDGKCAQCHGSREPKKGLSGQSGTFARLFAAEVARDPFCSSKCCRAWHGFSVNENERVNRDPNKSERIAQFIHGTHAAYRGGCRCAECSRNESLRRKERRRAIRNGEIIPGKHNAAAYRNGCRCDECRVDYVAWQRMKRAEKVAA